MEKESFEKSRTAVFIGHSECYGLSSERLRAVVEDLIRKGVTVFLNGGQGGFDRRAAGCVTRLKAEYPQIHSVLVLPYLSFHTWDPELYDESVYSEGLEKYHYKAAIPARNRYMVDNAAYAVCFVNHRYGGAAKTYARALKKGLTVINLAEK